MQERRRARPSGHGRWRPAAVSAWEVNARAPSDALLRRWGRGTLCCNGCTALSLGQTFSPSPETTPPPPPAPAPDRWLFMKELQGTLPGALLDSERMQVTGW